MPDPDLQNVTLASSFDEYDADQPYPVEYNVKIHVNRPIYTQEDFYRTYQISLGYKKKQNPFLRSIRSYWRREGYPRPSKQCLQLTVLSTLPCIQIMREYSFQDDFLYDVMAGLTVGFMHIPQGLTTGYFGCFLFC
jgi:hypothetical protein